MVDGLSNTANSQQTNTANTTSTANSKSVLGKDDFLKMMITQLKNQDPLNPADATKFSAQLAQFSSLEQLSNINSTLNQSINANYLLTQTINNTLSSTLIGKDVKLSGDTFQYNDQDSINLGYSLPSNASGVTVKIYNEQGALIKTIDNAPADSGDNKLSWDFTDNDGNKVSKGKYTFKAEATNSDGTNMQPDLFQYGTINGVRFSQSGTTLLVGGVEYQLSDILEILNGSSGGDN